MKVNRNIHKISVLGTDYAIAWDTPSNDPKLSTLNGYCDFTSKKIVIDKDLNADVYTVQDPEQCLMRILRHEIIHAFAYESGLNDNSWANNEEAIDWIALQFDKLTNAFDAFAAY